MGSAKTTFVFSDSPWEKAEARGLVVPVSKSGEALGMMEPLRSLDEALRGMVRSAAEQEEFNGSKGKTLTLRKTPGDALAADVVVLVGLGEAAKLTPDKVELAVQKAVESLVGLKDLQTVAIALPEGSARVSPETMVQAAVDGVYQATYRSLESTKPGPDLKQATLLIGKKADATLEAALREGIVLAEARSAAKDLVNKPANLKRTDTLVEFAQSMEGLPGLTVNVQADVAWIRENMPCFYTVAQGALASDPPKYITVKYRPKDAGKISKKIALVGKSVIFDTGGYQVKPGDSMVTMKGDMTGGAMVLATMRALSELQPPNMEVTAYLAATPNKIDSDAMLPDSIVNTTCGKRVEIRHTDAEGRLTLIDAVAKAAEEKPDFVLTIATLTGAAMRAVGAFVALMSNDEDLRGRVHNAAKSLGEPMQTLDVVEDDFEDIKSKLDGADIINTSKNKNRGAQSAAAFVMSGAPEGLPVVHLDIAGADMTGDEKATGIGQKTLIRFVMNESRGV